MHACACGCGCVWQGLVGVAGYVPHVCVHSTCTHAYIAHAHAHVCIQGLVGTAGYIDPIYANSGQYSQLTDGYALGVTLLVCLTGTTREHTCMHIACIHAYRGKHASEALAAAAD